MTYLSSLSARQGHGISDEDQEAYSLGYRDAIRDAALAIRNESVLDSLAGSVHGESNARLIESLA